MKKNIIFIFVIIFSMCLTSCSENEGVSSDVNKNENELAIIYTGSNPNATEYYATSDEIIIEEIFEMLEQKEIVSNMKPSQVEPSELEYIIDLPVTISNTQYNVYNKNTDLAVLTTEENVYVIDSSIIEYIKKLGLP